MQIEIKEVVSRRQLRRFAAFPNKLYKHNAYYVPQLLSGEMNVLSARKIPLLNFVKQNTGLPVKTIKLWGVWQV